jgi:hypothetical protein
LQELPTITTIGDERQSPHDIRIIRPGSLSLSLSLYLPQLYIYFLENGVFFGWLFLFT